MAKKKTALAVDKPKTTLAMTAGQRAAYMEMSVALRKKYVQIRRIEEKHNFNSLLARHKIGVIVRDVMGDERSYGDSAVKQLAVALGGEHSATMLYYYRNFARLYTWERVEEMLQVARPKGGPVTWTHFLKLSSLGADAPKLLPKVELEVLQEGLTTDELIRRIQELLGGKRSSGGRPVALPKTPRAALNKLSATTEAMKKNASVMDVALFGKIEEAAAEECTPQLLKQLRATQEKCMGLRKLSQDLCAKFDASIDRVTNVMAANEGMERPASVDELSVEPEAVIKPKRPKTNAANNSARVAAARKKRTKALAPA